MSTRTEELKLDIEEFNNLLQQANRRRCKDAINLEIRKLETELAKCIRETVKTESNETITHTSKKCYEVKLNNYGWDQTNTTVKLYISLKNVHLLPKEAVVCNLTEKSLDLRILGLENKNYSLTINNLCEDIDPSNHNLKVKTDMITVSLRKKIAKEWSHVTGVEKLIKEAKTAFTQSIGEDENADPAAGLMNLVKKMYEEGDDEMKRTIAKMMTESQEKRAMEAFGI